MNNKIKNVIKVDNCTMIYPNGIKALDNVSINISEGEIIGLLGCNGAGKTTLIKIMSAFYTPTAGNVFVYGKNTKEDKIWIRKKVGVVQQEHSYEPYVSTTKNLLIYGHLLGLSGEELFKNVEKIKNLFRLQENEAAELSTGNKKRLQVAREFLKIRSIMFLDEPTAGLDPLGRNQVLEQIKKLKQDGITIIYVTHILGEAELICDRIALMDKGKILHLAHPKELKNKVSNLKEIKISLKKKVPRKILRDLPVENVFIENDVLICRAQNELSHINIISQCLIDYGQTIEVRDLSLDAVFMELIGDKIE